MADYKRQIRGDATAYARYLSGMNASMRQKVALTAAHLLGEGVVADMGSGSGAGSDALASLYPGLTVIGVDVSLDMNAAAAMAYQRPNLSFLCADIASSCFASGSLTGIFDSSVLHHVTTFNGYDYAAAANALAVQVEQLEDHGTLIVRDFVDPGRGEVIIELPDDDGDTGEDPRSCSTAALFLRFAREFRPLGNSPGFTFEELPRTSGSRRFRALAKHAAEFVLRKDFRADWATEVLEEYTYFTQAEFETLFARLGLRILASNAIRNPWIVHNRFEGKFVLTDVEGEQLAYPPTNYIIVGEKVREGDGVRFVEAETGEAPRFLSIHHYRNVETGAVLDLVRRPHATIDIVPWFESAGELFVLARMSYPRPILGCRNWQTGAFDSAYSATYVTEPLNMLQVDAPLGRTVEEGLARYAAISPEQIRSFRPGIVHYPSPGGIEEEVRSALVEIDALFVQHRLENLSGFTTSGRVRAIEATQLLRAAQVGGLPEARLELNVYRLLQQLQRDAGPWIGDSIRLDDGESGADAEAQRLKGSRAQRSTGSALSRCAFEPLSLCTLEELRARPARRKFVGASETESRRFLVATRSRFDEVDGEGRVVAAQELEYVAPSTLSANTYVSALLARRGERILIGIDDDDLPAAQCFRGNSNLLVTPAWRLPNDIAGIAAAHAWISERLAAEYGLAVQRVWELGGRYHPSAGATPEVAYPFAIEVRPASAGARSLLWVDLAELVESYEDLVDGHLAIVAFRAAHALGYSSQLAARSSQGAGGP